MVMRLLIYCALLMLAGAAPAREGSSYEAPLPARLSTDPDLCAYVPCRDVLPAAESFSMRKGMPSYVEGYAGGGARRGHDGNGAAEKRHEDHEDNDHKDKDQEAGRRGGRHLVGYVFLSTDIVDIPGYSGKPVVTLIGMDTSGIITGIKVLRHSEPILLVGIPEEQLTKFTRQYIGKFVGSKIEVGTTEAGEGALGVDAISGATVTVIAENQVILRSGYEVAKQVGILEAKQRPQPRFADVEPPRDWAAMLREGSVQQLTVQPADIGAGDTGEPYIDMVFGYLNAPSIGTSILGADNYRRLMAELKPGEHAIFIAASGSGSFKGTGFVRGGIFDRIQVAQEMDTFTFRDTDYRNLYDIHTPGAPAYRESGIFIIRRPEFSPAYPWSLVFLASKIDNQTGMKSFVNFSREYWLPDRYLAGGRPHYQRPDPPWLRTWRSKAWEIGGFILILLLAVIIFASRDRLVRASSRRDKTAIEGPKYLIWTVSVVALGSYALAQPSITQVLTWFHSIIYHWKWELFLSDPFIFIFWWFIIITVFIWGRGLFCGWLCPYGAMTEILFNVSRRLGLRRYQFYLPMRWHDRLKWLKYFIFAGLLGLSFYSLPLAERFAEVEPFKTTFLLHVWNRSWPFAAYWFALAVLSLFMERPFCKYLCPLGAALAIPSTFRFFEIKRKSECTTCHACASGCTQLAIDSRGRINQRECLLCLDCMVMYYDSRNCPPLAFERRAREKAGLPLTRIDARGYFTPLPGGAAAVRPAPAAPAAAPPEAPRRWREELWFHLLPWSRNFGREIFAIRAVAAFLVVTVTTAWLLAAAHQIGAVIILAWWLGWSVYEIETRMHYKPLVKEGPWWRHDFRKATLADMIFYVGTKNLLIAAALFLIINVPAVAVFLRHISSQWPLA